MTTRLDDQDANRLLSTAVENIQRDYPVHWTHLISSPDDLRPQRELHPVFAGSYDWHSCVHQTWLIVRLLRLRPQLPGATEAVKALDDVLTPAGCAVEAEFFRSKAGANWERGYGWAWLLLLDAELRSWPEGDRWARAVHPIAEVLRDRWLAWLPNVTRPTRAGVHTNSAFAVSLTLDVSRLVGDEELARACELAAKRWFQADTGYGGFEPDAADFLSPALTEADLMRRVFSRERFAEWLDEFLPDLTAPRWLGLREPVTVDDPADPYGSHLSGLALSRAWGWSAIAAALPPDHRYATLAGEAADLHRTTGWRYVFGHGYAAEHWLGTFATYLDLGALTPS